MGESTYCESKVTKNITFAEAPGVSKKVLNYCYSLLFIATVTVSLVQQLSSSYEIEVVVVAVVVVCSIDNSHLYSQGELLFLSSQLYVTVLT